jgi:hypothetical protein
MTTSTRRLAPTLALVSLVLVGGCASARTRAAEPEELAPPRPRSASRPTLVGATIERPVSVELAVEVDEGGIPDVATLALTGAGADANRGVIVEWLRATVFAPARRNGVPVRGTFRMSAEASVSVVR